MSTIDNTYSGKTDISTISTKTFIRDMTLEYTSEAIKNVANNIPESSYKMREVVKAIHQSGAVDDFTEPVRKATITARDTAREISEIAKDDTVSTPPRKPPPPRHPEDEPDN